jgi:homoserine kinase
MGPGFDCLGIALDIWNIVSVEVGGQGFEIFGYGEGELPRNEINLVWSSIARVFDEAGRTMPAMSLTCHNDIPTTRGLGSSSAALVGGLVAGNELCGNPFTKEELLQMAADTEGHPDNVAPALFGGMQIAVSQDGRVVSAPVPVPENLSAVLYVPNTPMPTEEARGLLGDNVPRSDAVFNIGRAALLVRALATGDLEYLDIATEDRLHQPARQTIFFPMKNIIRAALGAGALGAFLSGAGSTVLAFATEKEFTIGYEMADAAVKSGLSGEVIITKPTDLGAHTLA